MKSWLCCVVILACFRQGAYGANCDTDQTKMQQTVENCISSVDITGFFNVSTERSFASVCESVILPMITCLEPNITGCAELLGLTINVTEIKETIGNVCGGMDEFLNPNSTRDCSAKQLENISCVDDSGLLDIVNMTDIAMVPGIDFVCGGRIDTLLTCLETEIADCEQLFGISTNLTWIHEIVDDVCRFLTKEPSCDLPRLPYTGYTCITDAATSASVNLDTSTILAVCGSQMDTYTMNCLEPNISACGRMFDVDITTGKIKQLFRLACDNLNSFGDASLGTCLSEKITQLQTCGTREAESFVTSQVKYFKDTTGVTIESGLSQFLCGFLKSVNTCFTSTVASCGIVGQLGGNALRLAVPNGCNMPPAAGGGAQRIGDGLAHVTVFTAPLLISLFFIFET